MKNILSAICINSFRGIKVQEFEHINGYYSVPELIRKPIDPVKNEVAKTEPAKSEPGVDAKKAPSNGNASATPVAAEKETPKEGKESEEKTPKDKDVIIFFFIENIALNVINIHKTLTY